MDPAAPIEPGADASASPTPPEPPKNPYAGTKHRVKVQDQELDVSYEDLVADYQHKRASNQKFEQAAKIRKEVDTLFDQMRGGDLSFLKQVVPPEVLRKFSEQELMEYVEFESQSDEKKEAIREKRRADALEEKLSAQQKRDLDLQQEQIQSQTNKEIENEIIDAVKSLGHDVKVTPRLIRRIAEQMQASLVSDDPNAQRMPARIAAARAWKGLEQDFEEFMGRAKPEEVIARLPRAIRDAIRKADFDSVSQGPTRSREDGESLKPDALPQSNRTPKFKRMTTDDWFNKMQKTIDKRG